MTTARLMDVWLCVELYILNSMITPVIVGGVDLTYIQQARGKGAVCLDGSPGAYQFDMGLGDGSRNWLIFLEGGGFFETEGACTIRANSSDGLGSSSRMTPKNFTGILSKNQLFNPDFYDWNRVYVRYCDGASYTGNRVDSVNKLHYKGAAIFDSIVEELLQKGMYNASKALLAGCSAGGLGAILNCAKFRSLLPTSVDVNCASDAGYFVHSKDITGNYSFTYYLKQIFDLHNSTENLPKCCTPIMNQSLCFYPQSILPQLQIPFFLINSAYDTFQIGSIFASRFSDPKGDWSACKSDIRNCSTDQLQKLKGLRSEVLKALPKGADGLFRGMFINSCFTHCQTQLQNTWYGNQAPRFDNKTIAEAVGDWFYGRRPFQQIDYQNELPQTCKYRTN